MSVIIKQSNGPYLRNIQDVNIIHQSASELYIQLHNGNELIFNLSEMDYFVIINT